MSESFDVIVVGAGFGGLGAALRLAELGARVLVVETLRYPGGCASTFRRDGLDFEAGATLVAGLEPHQPLGAWIARHGMEVETLPLDPVVTLRAPGLELPVHADRARFVVSLASLPGAPRDRVRAFFARQERIARTLWAAFEEPSLLPPLGWRALATHASRVARWAEVAPLVGRPLSRVLDEHGLSRFEPLRLFVDAVCQITVQCRAAEAEAPFALAALDYFWRGSRHVRGGLGALAWGFVHAIERLGGHVSLATRAKQVRRERDRFVVTTRRGDHVAPRVLLNVTPHAARTLVGPRPELDRLASRVESGWGACMLYLLARSPVRGPLHLELVRDPAAPLVEGNHVFVSVSEGSPREGCSTITASTHVHPERLDGPRVASIQAAMRRTLAELAPEWSDVEHSFTASPRTFERFTGRPGGWVGGVPRRAGLASYRDLGPCELERDLWLVGDSVFLGQSVLATALGGARTAEAVGSRGRFEAAVELDRRTGPA